MADTPLWNTRFHREMAHAERIGYPFKWGNIAHLNPATVEHIGIRGARLEEIEEQAEDNEKSNHRNSSGRTASLVRAGTMRKERNAIRGAHYERKGALEERKESARRHRWVTRHQARGAEESNWKRREMKHWMTRHPGKTSANWRSHNAKLSVRRKRV